MQWIRAACIVLALAAVGCGESMDEYLQQARELVDPAEEVWPKQVGERSEPAPAEPAEPKPTQPTETAPPASAPEAANEDEDEDAYVTDASRIVFRYTDDKGNLKFVTGIGNVPVKYRPDMKVVDGSKLNTYERAPTPVSAATRDYTPPVGSKLRGRPGGKWNSNQIDWLPLDQAKQRARRLQQAIMIVVYTSWCSVCPDFAKHFNDPEVATLAQDLVMVKGDSDEIPVLDRQYAPDGKYIPRVVFLSPSGDLDTSINDGGKHKFNFHGSTPTDLLRGMREAIEKYGK